MIKDNIANAKNYYHLSDRIKIGIEYLENADFSGMQNGKYDILGDESEKLIYAIVQDYYSKPLSEGKFEAHKKYIDIQYVVKGEEAMGVGDIADFDESTEYDETKDIVFLDPKKQSMPDLFELKEKEFVIFMPSDAHMPSLATEKSELSPAYVKKVVVKVRV